MAGGRLAVCAGHIRIRNGALAGTFLDADWHGQPYHHVQELAPPRGRGRKTGLTGVGHRQDGARGLSPDLLMTMANLELIIWCQDLWEVADKHFMPVIGTRTTKFDADHPDTLASKDSLASACQNQD